MKPTKQNPQELLRAIEKRWEAEEYLDVEWLINRVKKLEKVLQFYAELKNRLPMSGVDAYPDHYDLYDVCFWEDGHAARVALETDGEK